MAGRLTPQQEYAGHPTAPGPAEPDEFRMRRARQPVDDGVPGEPRVHPSPDRGHGPGIPGTTPTGPIQPGVIYNEGEDEGR